MFHTCLSKSDPFISELGARLHIMHSKIGKKIIEFIRILLPGTFFSLFLSIIHS